MWGVNGLFKHVRLNKRLEVLQNTHILLYFWNFIEINVVTHSFNVGLLHHGTTWPVIHQRITVHYVLFSIVLLRVEYNTKYLILHKTPQTSITTSCLYIYWTLFQQYDLDYTLGGGARSLDSNAANFAAVL